MFKNVDKMFEEISFIKVNEDKYGVTYERNNIVWNFTQWGNDLESEGAVKVAKSMYKSKKTTAKSTLCYGAQWDAILNFIDNNYYKECVEYNSVVIKIGIT